MSKRVMKTNNQLCFSLKNGKITPNYMQKQGGINFFSRRLLTQVLKNVI